MHESTFYDHNSYITLTYSDAKLPANLSLDREVLPTFFKRLRGRLEGQRIKYFAAGEYGEKFGRPHYHAILFGVGGRGSKTLLEDVWENGFVDVSGVGYDSCRYVADYIGKQLTGPLSERYGDRVHPFAQMSKGLGRRYAEAHADELVRDLCVRMRGVEMSLPRYYVKRLEIPRDPREAKAREYQREVWDHHLKYAERHQIPERIRQAQYQMEKDALARDEIRRLQKKHGL